MISIVKRKLSSIVKRIKPSPSLEKRFKVEIDLIKGRERVESNSVSLIHFSLNKAATQYVKSVLRKIAPQNNLIPVSVHGYAFATNFPYLDKLSFEEMNDYKHIFRTTGYLYSVFGGMIRNIDSFEKYRVVLSIRDPRDILVSGYYSAAFSHATPPKTSNSRAPSCLREKGFNNVVLLKYEDMINSYELWLTDFINKTGLTVSDSLREELIDEFKKVKPKKEDKSSHNRK